MSEDGTVLYQGNGTLIESFGESIEHDDLRIIDRYIVADTTGVCRYMVYRLVMSEDDGPWTEWVKVVKLCKISHIPKEMREKKAMMVIQDEMLSAIWSQNLQFVCVYANILRPTQIGLLYCYGVQVLYPVMSESGEPTEEERQVALQCAMAKADSDYHGIKKLLEGNYRQSQFRELTLEETEALRNTMETASNLQVLRGIPKTHIASGSSVVNTIMGTTSTPDAVEQNEEFIRGLLKEQYAVIIVASPIPNKDLLQWSKNVAEELSLYKSQINSTKSFNAGISMPMVFAGNLSASLGNSSSVSDSESHNLGISEGLSESVSDSTSHSQATSLSSGVSHGTSRSLSDSFSKGISESYSESASQSKSLGQSVGISESYGVADSTSHSVSRSASVSHGISQSFGESSNYGDNWGTNQSSSHGISSGTSDNYGTSTSQGTSHSNSISDGTSQGTSRSVSTGQNWGMGQNWGISSSDGVSQGTSQSHGTSNNQGFNQGTSQSTGQSTSYGQSVGSNIGTSYGQSIGQSSSTSTSLGASWGDSGSWSISDGESKSNGNSASTGGNVGVGIGGVSHSEGSNSSAGTNSGFSNGGSWSSGGSSGSSNSHSTSQGSSYGQSTGQSWGENRGIGNSTSLGSSNGISNSFGTSTSQGTNYGTSHTTGSSHGVSQSYGTSLSQSMGTNQGTSHTVGSSTGTNQSFSNTNSHGISNGISDSTSFGSSLSHSIGKGFSRSVGENYSTSQGLGESLSKGHTVSSSHGRNMSNSISESYGTGQSHGLSQSVSQGRSVGQGVSDSVSQSRGQTVSDGIARSVGTGHNVGRSEAQGTSRGVSNGNTSTMAYGQGMNFSLGPSIGVSRAYQIYDEVKNNLVKILEEQNNRLHLSTRMGAFYVDMYMMSHEKNTKAAIGLLARSAFGGDVMPASVQVVNPDPMTSEHLLKHASVFTACTQKEHIQNIMEGYLWSTVMLSHELAAVTHLPRVEAGGAFTVTDNIPPFTVRANKKGEIYLGKQINYENAEPCFDFSFDKSEFMHTLICGASGSGKTNTAQQIAREVIDKYKDMKVLVLDWKNSWRVLKRFSKVDEFDFYSLDPYGVRPIAMNVYVPPEYVSIMQWKDRVHESLCLAYGFGNKQYALLNQVIHDIFLQKKVLVKDNNGIPREAPDARERIKKVTLGTVYQHIERLKEDALATDKKGKPKPGAAAGKSMLDAYDSILAKLFPFYAGELSEMYCCTDDKKMLHFHELINGKRVVVLEGGDLDEQSKKFVISLMSWGVFMYSRLRKSRERKVEKRFFILEEAHRIITGDKQTDSPLQVSEDIFQILFNEAREYGIYAMPIVQTPSHLPANVVTNCSILIVHRLGGKDDIEMMTLALTRNGRIDHKDVPLWLTKQPVGQCIVRINNQTSHQYSEPILIQSKRVRGEAPDDEELVMAFDLTPPPHIRKKMNDDIGEEVWKNFKEELHAAGYTDEEVQTLRENLLQAGQANYDDFDSPGFQM